MSHEAEKEAALWESLRTIGVGKAYHKRSLSEDEDWEKLYEWASDPLPYIAEGEGWTFIGEAPAVYDAAVLMARAMHIQGKDSYIAPLRRIAGILEHGYSETSERMHDAKCLFITQFYEDVDAPLTGWQIKGIETLITDRLDNKQCTFIHSPRDPTHGSSWWSTGLIRRVETVNQRYRG